MNDWKDIPGYEGSYQISIGGHVKSLPREVVLNHTGAICKVKGCIMKPQFTSSGERIAWLSKNGYRTRFFIRDLVREAFPNEDLVYKD